MTEVKTGSIGYDEAPDGTRFEIVYTGDNKFGLLVNSVPIVFGVRWDTIESLLTAITEAKGNVE